jgi:CheY-like chemotaxis protein
MATESNNVRRSISELLKSADRAIKDGDLDASLTFIEHVFEIDARNIYARAYKERLLALKDAQAKEIATEKKRVAEKPPESEVSAEKKTEAKAPPHVSEKVAPPEIEVPAEQKTEAKAPPHVSEKVAPPSSTKPSHGKPGKLHISHSPAAIEAYRTLLVEIWHDGNVSSEEQSQIDSMKETFEISEKEHTEVERQARIEAYLNAIREAWKTGITSFVDIRQRFKITDQEHLSVEQKINQFLQSLKSRGTVLLLDDDQAFLSIIKDVLGEAGFNCLTVTSGEEGLVLLESVTPDVVICDIDFVKPLMNGFTFYEKFRAIDRFVDVPLVFMSGLDQDIVVRAGKQMGADDYLTKPVDAEMLVATIEGKLKRSREIKRVTRAKKS